MQYLASMVAGMSEDNLFDLLGETRHELPKPDMRGIHGSLLLSAMQLFCFSKPPASKALRIAGVIWGRAVILITSQTAVWAADSPQPVIATLEQLQNLVTANGLLVASFHLQGWSVPCRAQPVKVRIGELISLKGRERIASPGFAHLIAYFAVADAWLEYGLSKPLPFAAVTT